MSWSLNALVNMGAKKFPLGRKLESALQPDWETYTHLWVEGGEGLEKKVGGEPGGRVATHSGPSGDSAMRRVTLFLNGSPKNGKVRGSVGRR